MAAAVRKLERTSEDRCMVGFMGDDGKLFDKEIEQSDEEYAYDLLLRQCDPDALRAEAERLYEEVIAGYADVPLITVQHRKLEALLKEPTPRRGTASRSRPKTGVAVEEMLARKQTLGQAAEARLDDMHNLDGGQAGPGDRRRGPRRQAPEALRLSRQGRRPGLLGHVVRPVHARDPERTGACRAAQGQAVRHAGRQLRRRQAGRAQGDPGRADHLAQLARRRAGDRPHRQEVSRRAAIRPCSSSMRRGSIRSKQAPSGDSSARSVDDLLKELEARMISPPIGTVASRSPGISSPCKSPDPGRFDPTRCSLATRSCLQTGRGRATLPGTAACTGEFLGKIGSRPIRGMVHGLAASGPRGIRKPGENRAFGIPVASGGDRRTSMSSMAPYPKGGDHESQAASQDVWNPS